MISPICNDDAEEVDSVWFEAYLEAHGFIPRSYWEAKEEDKSTLKIRMSDEIVVHTDDETGRIDAYLDNDATYLAALFVDPRAQGKGHGSRMFRIAGRMHPELTLSVYKENERAVAFYRRRGLVVLQERVEERTGHRELVMGRPEHADGQALV